MSTLMKESGVDWIGLIPHNWDIKRVKDFLFYEKKKNNVMKSREVLSLTLNGVIDKDINSNKGLNPSDYDTYQIVSKNNLIFKLIDLANFKTSRVGLIHRDGIMSSAYIKLINFNNSNVRYSYYYFYSLYLRGVFNYLGGNGVRSTLTYKNLLNMPFLNVDLATQEKIACYLDDRIESIKGKTDKNKRKIELLKEYHDAIIFETVTKGLEKNVKMKDSGVDWIGEIPQDWEIKRVKDLFNIGRGVVIAASELKKEKDLKLIYPVYSSATENDGIIGFMEDYKFNRELITWTTDGVNAGTIFKRIGKFNCTNVCGTLIPKNNKNYLDYFKFMLISQTKFYKRPDINGAKIMNNEMARIMVSVPPLETQQKIADYLDVETTKINKEIEKLINKNELLEELESSLIFETVTGKIDVDAEGEKYTRLIEAF